MSDPTSGSSKAQSAPSGPPPSYQNDPSLPNYQPAPANYGGTDYNATPPVQHYDPTNVYQQQPRAGGTGGGVTRPAYGDNYLTLSIVLTVLCCLCGFTSMICTIPAIIFANAAREAEARGNENGRRANARLSLAFNIGAIVWWMMLATAVVIYTGITQSSSSTTADDTVTTVYHS